MVGCVPLNRLHSLGETLDALGFGFVGLELVDPGGDTLVFRAVNQRASGLAGVPLQRVVGRTVDEVLPSVRAAGLVELYVAVARDGQPRQLERVRIPVAPMEGEVFRLSAFRVGDRFVGIAFDNVRHERQQALDQVVELLHAIQHLAAGRETGTAGSEPPPLTEREREIVSLVAGGLTSREIAQRLGLSIRTVETHRANVMRKLELHTTAELALYAARAGMVPAGR